SYYQYPSAYPAPHAATAWGMQNEVVLERRDWERDLGTMHAAVNVTAIDATQLVDQDWMAQNEAYNEKMRKYTDKLSATGAVYGQSARRKNQLTFMATQAAQRQMEEDEKRRLGKMQRAETRAKYGW